LGEDAEDRDLRYASAFSGIGTDAIAWHSLGWECAWFAETDKFPCEVLRQRFPGVPNLGDVTKIGEDHGPVDLLVGGPPCQPFSVAGKRGGLDDPRGNMALEFIALAARLRARWFVFENVPGLLSSSKGRDFARILRAVSEHGYGAFWRVLDAQNFGVPQRRRRVFLVGYLGDWRPAAAVLLERESQRGNPPKGKKARAEVTGTLEARAGTGGHDPGAGGASSGHLVAGPLQAHSKKHGHAMTTQQAAEAGQIVPAKAATLTQQYAKHSGRTAGRNCGVAEGHLVPIDMRQASRGEKMTNNRPGGSSGGPPGTGIGNPGDPSPVISGSHIPAVSYAVNAKGAQGRMDGESETFIVEGDSAASTPKLPRLRAGCGRGGETAIAFSCKDHGADAGESVPTLRSMGHDASHANAGGQVAVAFHENQQGEVTLNKTVGSIQSGGGKPGQGYPAVAFTERTRAEGRTVETQEEKAYALLNPGEGGRPNDRQILTPQMAVRRLTPRECERLQGLPDSWTEIAWRGKPPDKCPDGPRYRAIGNGMAAPCLAWIGRRIQQVEDMLNG